MTAKSGSLSSYCLHTIGTAKTVRLIISVNVIAFYNLKYSQHRSIVANPAHQRKALGTNESLRGFVNS